MKFTVVCIKEPRGDAGLEGFVHGITYRAELMVDKKGKTYFRVYLSQKYWEYCSPQAFSTYFRTVRTQ